jgi:hypothetical protein
LEVQREVKPMKPSELSGVVCQVSSLIEPLGLL